MIKWLSIFLHTVNSAFQSHRDLAFENLMLRQQLAVMMQHCSRPSIYRSDRQFWVLASKVWPKWRDALCIVRPETDIHWHKKGFRRFWARKSKRRGRPQVDAEIRKLIRRMCVANPLWGAPRIHGELLKLGLNVSEATVSKYMTRHCRPPSQTWRTFLANHASDIVAIDFLTVPTATFRVLFVLVILSHDRRKILHTNVTEHPTALWTARQVVDAVGLDDVRNYVLRDRDAIYSRAFSQRIASVGLTEVVTAPRSPWQNPYVERVIDSIRRECLDHTIIVGEWHLRRVVRNYVRYYNDARTHLSLGKDAPVHRQTHPPEVGSVTSKSHCGGLHNEYLREAA